MSIKDLMSIYSSQTLGNIIIPRFSVYSTENFNIASYFGGEDYKDMVILKLEENEEPKKFKIPLINFFYSRIRGEIDKINNEMELEKYFFIDHEQDMRNQSQTGAIEQRFDILLSVFNNFIGTIDKRMTQIENLILKITEYIQK